MFFKIGFFVLLAVVIALVVVFMKTNPMIAEGAGSWTDFYSSDTPATVKFFNDVFGIEAIETSNAVDGSGYTTLKAAGQLWPFAGIMGQPTLPDGNIVPPSSMIYLTTKNYDETHRKMLEAGAIALAESQTAGEMKFGVYVIPGGLTIGVAQYVKK